MKKLVGMIVCGMLVLGVTGCSSSSVEEEPKEETKIEEQVTEEKEEEIQEEAPEIVTIENDEDFKHYLTSSLEDSEYDRYFDTFFTGEAELQKVEFDANIVAIDAKDGYDTRLEVLLAPGDYSETEVTGPSIKIEDIPMTKLGGLDVKSNVRVVGTIWGYNEDKCYVNFHVESIESR